MARVLFIGWTEQNRHQKVINSDVYSRPMNSLSTPSSYVVILLSYTYYRLTMKQRYFEFQFYISYILDFLFM